MAREIASPGRKRCWSAMATSFLAILALLIAPICSRLCAAQTCSPPSGTASDAPCHSASVSQHGAAHLHSVRNCSAPELQAIVPASVTRADHLQPHRSIATAASELVISRELPASLKCLSGVSRLGSPPIESLDFTSAPVILRI